MESTLSAATTTTMLLAAMPKTLNQTSNSAMSRLRSQIVSLQVRSSKALKSVKYSSYPLTSLCAVGVPPAWSRLQCVASSAASFASTADTGGGGGGDRGDGGSGDGGGGDGAADGGEAKSNSVVGSSEEVEFLSSDVIILDVRGMTCGGCAAKVKSILESQPLVSSASVNLETETATVWPVSEAKVTPNWQKHVGETLAKHLTSCGFSSNLRDQGVLE